MRGPDRHIPRGRGASSCRALARFTAGALAVVVFVGVLVGVLAWHAPAASAAQFTQCPPVDLATGCSVLITLQPDGSAQLSTDAGSGNPYDGNDGDIIGIVNNSGQPVTHIALSSNVGIFGFDGDGMCSSQTPAPKPAGCPFDPVTSDLGSDYAGPGITFSGAQAAGGVPLAAGVVTVAGGLAPGASDYFALEGNPTAASFTLAPPSPPPPAPGKSTPTLQAAASPTGPGSMLHEQATLAGGTAPGGSISFTLFTRGDCSGPPAGSTTVAVSGDGTYVSGAIRVDPGSYWWQVAYSGDSQNNAVGAPCGDAVVVNGPGPAVTGAPSASPTGSPSKDRSSLTGTRVRAAPTLTTASPRAATLGDVTASAVLAGGSAPAGTVTFSVFGGTSCSGTPVAHSVVPASGDATYSSGTLSVPSPGTFALEASYSGDQRNAAAVTPCTQDALQIAKAPVTVTPGPGLVSGMLATESITLAGGVAPTGTVMFTLYGDATCSGTAVTTGSAAVNGPGTYQAGPLPLPAGASAAGTLHVIASYGGDASNTAAATPCSPAATGATTPTAAPAAIPLNPAGPPAQVALGVRRAQAGLPAAALWFVLVAALLCLGWPAWLVWNKARAPRTLAAGVSVAGVSALEPALARTRRLLLEQVGVVAARERMDDRAWDGIEDMLARAGIGLTAAGLVITQLRAKDPEPAGVLGALHDALLGTFGKSDRKLRITRKAISVWLVAGPPDAGTTSVAERLATSLTGQGTSAVAASVTDGLAPALDDALASLGGSPGGSPGGTVVLDAGSDPEQVRRLRAALRSGDHQAGDRALALTEALLVVDASRGPEGLDEADAVRSALEPTGTVVTRLDQTDRAAILIAAERELRVPVKAVSFGHGSGDFSAFRPPEFVGALLEQQVSHVD